MLCLSKQTNCWPPFRSTGSRSILWSVLIMILILGWSCQLLVSNRFLQVIAAGRWLKLEKTTYVDPAGNSRSASLSARSPFFLSKISLHIYLLPNQRVGDGKEDNEASGCGVRRWAPPAALNQFCRGLEFDWLCLQASGSSPCWSGPSTKTAWWWWSSSAHLWDATLWSFLQVRCWNVAFLFNLPMVD